eukprot:TRINITY_DN5928_c0_g1_i1.p1 TRINITY_DN5928_c0_g1~~TRINITY_DN5928_c0_g1_i1.p1  ORF type:complete len:496 (-),score=92.09 TRINITY_DN5928_c0_g1_i1:29-1489(-)
MATHMLAALGSGLGSNAIFSGGVLLLIATYFMNYIRQAVTFLVEYILRRFFIEIELKPNDDAFRWLITYISENQHILSASQTHRVLVVRKQRARKRYQSNLDDVNITDPPKIIFAPGHGLHIIWYQKRLIIMHRGVSLGQTPVMDDGSGMGGSALGSGSDKIVLWAPGWAGARACLESLIGEAMQYTCGKDKEKTIIFSYARTMCWDRALTKPKRSLESVILPADLVDTFKKDVRRFLDSSEWYQELGIPYRRSYLLHGPPGCGKTSFVTALAGEFGLHVCVLNLGEGNLSDSSLNSALHAAPDNSIILIEDIDSALPSRNETSISNTAATDATGKAAAPNVNPRLRSHSVTFSGILNAVDGIASQESRIIVMTTNVLTSLDPALTRPGRVDRVFYFGLATQDQARRLFVRFFPKELDLADKFASLVEPGAVSMAGLQGLFMQYADDPLAACNNYHSYLEELKRHDQPAAKAPENPPSLLTPKSPQ